MRRPSQGAPSDHGSIASYGREGVAGAGDVLHGSQLLLDVAAVTPWVVLLSRGFVFSKLGTNSSGKKR